MEYLTINMSPTQLAFRSLHASYITSWA